MQDVILEEQFHSIVGSQHMRQWFKLRKAYAMMEDARVTQNIWLPGGAVASCRV